MDDERKEAEAIKEKVAKDEGAVATRQNQVKKLVPRIYCSIFVIEARWITIHILCG